MHIIWVAVQAASGASSPCVWLAQVMVAVSAPHGQTEGASLSKQAVQNHTHPTFPLRLLSEVGAIKLCLRHACIFYPFLDVILKFSEALTWVRAEFYKMEKQNQKISFLKKESQCTNGLFG